MDRLAADLPDIAPHLQVDVVDLPPVHVRVIGRVHSDRVVAAGLQVPDLLRDHVRLVGVALHPQEVVAHARVPAGACGAVAPRVG